MKFGKYFRHRITRRYILETPNTRRDAEEFENTRVSAARSRGVLKTVEVKERYLRLRNEENEERNASRTNVQKRSWPTSTFTLMKSLIRQYGRVAPLSGLLTER